MNNGVLFGTLLVASYLLGGIPTSYIFGKIFKHIDIRNFGSGNVGATNALRVLGVKMGVTTLILDIGKGFVAVYLSKLMMQKYEIGNMELILIFVGMAAITGHIFSIYLGFKGGKGVATSAGVFLALIPMAFGIAFAIFFIVVALSKYVSLGSILAAVTLVAGELIINFKNGFSQKGYLVFTIIIALFIIIKHKSNIKRLMAGNENKISFKGKK